MRRLILSVFSLVFLPSVQSSVLAQSLPPVDYSRDVKPILSAACYACHGPDEGKRKAKLRLDVRDNAIARAIRPGNSKESPLVERILATDHSELMPPPASKKDRLTVRQVETLKRWINEGAKYDVHWAYVKPVRPSLPLVSDPSRVRSALDAFVLARLDREGFPFSPEADRLTLIRRLSFDLLGLPPTPAEVDAFLSDVRPDAYERLVDQLLGSERFGERMALYWLDLVRYADTGGYHSDNHRDVALFRDYVIAAFNANKRFDDFTREQLAGDLLPRATLEQRVASGYNRLLQTTEEGGAQAKEYTAKYAADRVRNASSVWLAGTMGCAECHNHKFDPFTTKDFYRFAAFFADLQERAVGRQDQTPIARGESAARLAALDGALASLQTELARPGADADAVKKVLAEFTAQRTALLKTIPTTLVAKAGPPRMVRVLPRGNWLDDSGEVVQPGLPEFLNPPGTTGPRASRLDLANWIVSRDNPLTARVFVNRLWKIAFGQGLVKSLDDFGTQGSLPSHPALLDWLAVEFMDSGWDVKHLFRQILRSHTYRQSSLTSPALRERDPGNVLLARQSRYRLDAEMVRDNALAMSGLLSQKIGGASVKPYQPAGYWAYLNFPTREWQSDQGEDQYRRGLYTYWCRTFLHPSLLAFDAPTREECTVERPRSSTPLQALVLLNDPMYVEAARALAERILRQPTGDVTTNLTTLYRLALSRAPRPEEIRLLSSLHQKHREEFHADAGAARQLLSTGQRPLPPEANLAELAAWTSVARVILNLHETITRN